MSQQRIICGYCRARIAVERGFVRKRIQATDDGEIVSTGSRVVVRCRRCGHRQVVYSVKP